MRWKPPKQPKSTTVLIMAYSYRGEFPWETTLADTLLKRSPRLHLLGEEGRTTVSGKMPSVRSLPTWVNAWERRPTGRSSRSSPYVPQKLALRELFSAFPNLEGLSVSVSRLQGGCVISSEPPDTKIHELPDNEAFPPLQSLSLSGYNIQSEEQVWLEKFPWQHLRSLSLGKQNSPGFLEVATGRVQSLTEFRITSYDFRNTEDPQLDTFLSSFHTLESLTAKGTVPSLDTVAHHTNLRHLCLHAIETPKEDRQTLDAKQISDLDWHLPRLRSLEIDLDPDGTWVSLKERNIAP